jgi:hypothetical protein
VAIRAEEIPNQETDAEMSLDSPLDTLASTVPARIAAASRSTAGPHPTRRIRLSLLIGSV